MTECMITTEDNPYSPFTQFDEWLAYDEQKGYYTCEYLARVTHGSYDLSDADNDLAQEIAIDSIVELNLLGIYKKVTLADYTQK